MLVTSIPASVATALIVESETPLSLFDTSIRSLSKRMVSAAKWPILMPIPFSCRPILSALNCKIVWKRTTSLHTRGTKNAVVGLVSDRGCQGKHVYTASWRSIGYQLYLDELAV